MDQAVFNPYAEVCLGRIQAFHNADPRADVPSNVNFGALLSYDILIKNSRGGTTRYYQNARPVKSVRWPSLLLVAFPAWAAPGDEVLCVVENDKCYIMQGEFPYFAVCNQTVTPPPAGGGAPAAPPSSSPIGNPFTPPPGGA